MPVTPTESGPYILQAQASGFFIQSSTWLRCLTPGYLDTEVYATTLPTTFSLTPTFTPGAVTVDGVAFKLNSVTGVLGTVTVALDQGGSTVAGTSTTVNVSDLAPLSQGWVFFKFSAPVLLAAATAYTAKALCSLNNVVSLFRDFNNVGYAKFLRTTTAQAPAANDWLYITPEVAPSVATAIPTVTMDNTANLTLSQVDVGGTLAFAITAFTSFLLKVGGLITIWKSGTLRAGSSGTPYPATSTATLQCVCASNNTQFLRNMAGTISLYGASKTCFTFLTANIAAAATTANVVSTIGWVAGDTLCFGSTSYNYAECEAKALTTVNSGTQVAMAAVTNAHTGTSPYIGEVGNLTRNVRVLGTSVPLGAYLQFNSPSVTVCWNVEFMYMNGLNLYTTASGGTIDIQGCSIHDGALGANGAYTQSGFAGITFNNNVTYNIPRTHINVTAGSSSTNSAFTNNLLMLSTDYYIMLNMGDADTNYSGNYLVGQFAALSYLPALAYNEAALTNSAGYMDNITIHSCVNCIGFTTSQGYQLVNPPFSYTMSGLKIWKCSQGIIFNVDQKTFNCTINNFSILAASSAAIVTMASIVYGLYTFNNGNIQGDTSVNGVGVSLNSGTNYGSIVNKMVFNNCAIGNVNRFSFGINHTYPSSAVVELNNCLLQAIWPFYIPNSVFWGYYSSQRHNQIDGNYMYITRLGMVTPDTVFYATSSPGVRISPLGPGMTTVGPSIFISIPAGQSPSVTVKLRKSTGADGSVYTGIAPRLVIRANPNYGTIVDSTLATTTSAANGAFETLTVTLPSSTAATVAEVFVECGGIGVASGGWVTMDDVSTTQTGSDTSGLAFTTLGQPSLQLGIGTAGGGAPAPAYYSY